MPSNLPGAWKSVESSQADLPSYKQTDLPPVFKRRSRAPLSQSHQRSSSRGPSSYTVPWRQEEPEHHDTYPKIASTQDVFADEHTRLSNRQDSATEPAENLSGPSLTRWHLMQCKRLLDEPFDGGPSMDKDFLSMPADQPLRTGNLTQPDSHMRTANLTPPAVTLTKERHSSLRRQQTTSIEFMVNSEDQNPTTASKDRTSARSERLQADTGKLSSGPRSKPQQRLSHRDDREGDKENAPDEPAETPRSETDASMFSGYFPVTQHTNASKPACVPSLGLEGNSLMPSAWLSGHATQGDTYGN